MSETRILRVVEAGAEAIVRLESVILQLETRIMATLQTLLADVQAQRTADQSIITLCTGIAAQLRAAGGANDPQLIQEIANQLERETAGIVAAVQENTQAPPAGPDPGTGGGTGGTGGTDTTSGGGTDNTGGAGTGGAGTGSVGGAGTAGGSGIPPGAAAGAAAAQGAAQGQGGAAPAQGAAPAAPAQGAGNPGGQAST